MRPGAPSGPLAQPELSEAMLLSLVDMHICESGLTKTEIINAILVCMLTVYDQVMYTSSGVEKVSEVTPSNYQLINNQPGQGNRPRNPSERSVRWYFICRYDALLQRPVQVPPCDNQKAWACIPPLMMDTCMQYWERVERLCSRGMLGV